MHRQRLDLGASGGIGNEQEDNVHYNHLSNE